MALVYSMCIESLLFSIFRTRAYLECGRKLPAQEEPKQELNATCHGQYERDSRTK